MKPPSPKVAIAGMKQHAAGPPTQRAQHTEQTHSVVHAPAPPAHLTDPSAWLRTVVARWLRGFVFGYAFDTLPGLIVVSITTLVKRIRVAAAGGPSLPTSFRKDVARILSRSDAVQLGCFLGTWGAAMAPLQRALSAALPDRTALASVLAGCLSGLAILILGDRYTFGDIPRTVNAHTPRDVARAVKFLHSPPRRLTTWSLMIAVRTLNAAFQVAWNRRALPTALLSAAASELTYLAMFMFGCFEIMYCWFYTPRYLPPGLEGWISDMSRVDFRLHEYVRARGLNIINKGDTTNILEPYFDKYAIPHHERIDPASAFLPCTHAHPLDQTCLGNAFRRARRGFLAALMLYVPVQVVGVIVREVILHIRQRNQPHFRPEEAESSRARVARLTRRVAHLGMDAGRAASLFGTFIFLIWYSICFMRNFERDDTFRGPFLGSALCGLSVLIERPYRRAEMALNAFPRGLYSFYSRCYDAGLVPYIKNFDVALFSVTSGLVCLLLTKYPTDFPSTYRSLLGYFTGL